MSEPEVKASRPDIAARTLAILSLFVSGAALFFSTLQPASIRIGVGKHMLVSSKPRVGILCTLVNTGARPAIVRTATLRWDAPATDLQLTLVSTKLEEWTFDDKGGKQLINPTTYTLVAPIAVKGHDQATAILWFTANTPFNFTPGQHNLVLQLEGGGDHIWQAQLVSQLSALDISSITNNPVAAVPIQVTSD